MIRRPTDNIATTPGPRLRSGKSPIVSQAGVTR
ncbi:hypothetical protein SNOUR_19700 [Streptomyces noursei ATCC 11455]|nr:hypothetical protein SNOUR_19700 [Streptomyces noursei ATCC 11455]